MGADSTDIIARLAGAQHGAVAVRQVIEAGVTRRWIDNLVDRDVLRRTAAGVYVVNGSEPTWHQRLSVGLLSLGDQAWVSFEAAAALHRFDRALREPVDFTVLRELRNRAKACPYRVHTTVTMPPIDVVHVDGFPCTSASRNVLDLALGRAPTIRLEAAIDSAIRRGLSSPTALSERLASLRGPGRWGVRRIDQLLPDTGGHTMLERRFLELVRLAGLPRPRTQVIHRKDGKHVARVDFLFDPFGVVIEVSGRLGHTSDAERARDAQRRNELQDLGRKVYEYTWADVKERPGYVEQTLTVRLHDAGWRR